jgi:uncharacterized protein (DUF849 family)/tripartite-type tricarboxylate transporter receptor subunit TctC
MTLRRTLALAAACFPLLAAAPAAQAGAWPDKPVRILVGAPPGGTADIIARLVAHALQGPLGQSVIVDYKAGAGGTIAVQNLISGPRDGYTFLVIQKGIASEVPLAIKVSYNPFKDIVPVAQLTRQGLIFVGNPSVPAKNLGELVSYIKANPGKIDYANFGIGMRGQTIGVQFNRLAGLDTGSVSYKGSPPALQDVMGGQVPLMFDAPATSLPFIKAGKLKPFAVAFPRRIAASPMCRPSRNWATPISRKSAGWASGQRPACRRPSSPGCVRPPSRHWRRRNCTSRSNGLAWKWAPPLPPRSCRGTCMSRTSDRPSCCNPSISRRNKRNPAAAASQPSRREPPDMAAPQSKIIVTCAVTGGIHTPSMSPYLPVTPEEIAREALAAADAGASIVHLHARKPENGQPSQDPALFREFLPEIARQSDVVINLTTGGAPNMLVEERLQPALQLKPEVASLNMGSMNFGLYPMLDRYKTFRHDWEQPYLAGSEDRVFRNTFKEIRYILESCADNGTRFEIECYDTSHLYTAAHFIDRGILKPPFFIQSVFGLLGGIGTHADDVMHMRRTAERLFGKDYYWSVLGAGRSQIPIATMAASMGGNVRVGLEDSLWDAPGQLATSNAQQVRRIVSVLTSLNLEVASPAETRAMLQLKGKREVGF